MTVISVALAVLCVACGTGAPRSTSDAPAAPARPQDRVAATQGPIGCNPLSTADRIAILERLNEARGQPRRCGSQSFAATDALSWDSRLERAASGHSSDMAGNDFFSHTGSDGLGIAERVRTVDYRYRRIGENIAAGQHSEQQALAGWLTSEGHCRNIMEPAYRDTALACVADPNSSLRRYWTQVFGVEQ